VLDSNVVGLKLDVDAVEALSEGVEDGIVDF
jgi:hypothetical protein